MTMKITKLGIMLLLLLAVGGCQTDAVSSGQPAKSPQQLLAEQPIDDAHDAFLVDTGGRLGTLLVTAELTAAYKDEFGTQDITFAVWDPADPAQPFQTFTEEVMLGIAPEYHQVVDANFDGFLDFGYLFHAGNQPHYFHFWLWNEQQRKFTYCAPMVEISAPAFDEERQLVTGWARSSGAGDGIFTLHRWEDGEPVCVRRVESSAPWEKPGFVSVQERVDGELRQIYHEEFPWNGEEPEGQETWRQAFYLWCDLDYHGEAAEEN